MFGDEGMVRNMGPRSRPEKSAREVGPRSRLEKRLQLPVPHIVHNNDSWGVIRQGQPAALDLEFHTSLAGTDHAAIICGFDCHNERVDDARESAAAIERARVQTACGDRLPHEVRFAPGSAGVRQREPPRIRGKA